MANFFSRLSYSFGNEDWNTEQKALSLKATDRVLCITASGDRPLHLLLAPCQEIVSVDANPIQNHLLHLKKAALQTLDYENYVGFLGATQCNEREQLFEKVIENLDLASKEFWIKNKKKILAGVIYQGTVERWCKRLAYLIHFARGAKIKKLFSFDDIEAQKEYVLGEWNQPLWRKSFDLALHPRISQFFLKDPGLYENLGDDMKPGRYIFERMQQSLCRYLAKENFLISLILNGNVMPDAFPPCLKLDGTEQIRKGLNRLTTQTADVISYLENCPPQSFDAFSFSDVASYLSQENFERLLKALIRAAKPEARFCLRQFLSAYPIPEKFAPFIQRDPLLEKELQNEDRCFVYNFTVGKVIQ